MLRLYLASRGPLLARGMSFSALFSAFAALYVLFAVSGTFDQLTNLATAPTDPVAEQARIGELAAQAARLTRCAGIRGRDRRAAGRPFCE